MADTADLRRAGPLPGVGRFALRFGGLIGTLAATFLGLLAVTFVIGRVIPIDPVLAIVGERATQAQYEAAREALGLNEPIIVQFGIYVRDALIGDFGTSLLTARPVLEDVARVFPATLELATVATIIGVLAGVPLGVLAASRQGGVSDQAVRLFGLMGYSMPVFWLGLMGLLIFYGELGWVGGPGRLDTIEQFEFELAVPEPTGAILLDTALAGEWALFANAFSHIVLPAGVLGYYSLAYISRMTRSFMLEQLSQEYVTTARVKGMPEWRVVWVHAFRNVLVPLITVIALSYANLLEGSVLTETVFAWPGLGLYITNALFNADIAAVMGGTIVIGVMFIFLNLLSDVLYRVVDPRARRA
jgi:peptide/nickel transport system permease protein